MKHSKSGLFLMEMIVCLLFFALSAAVCAQMFAKSHSISNTAINENHAVIAVSNLAECYYSEFGDLNSISGKFFDKNSEVIGDDTLRVYYDEAFQPTDKSGESCPYYSEIHLLDPENATFREGVISFFSREEKGGTVTTVPVYSLDVTVNIPNRK